MTAVHAAAQRRLVPPGAGEHWWLLGCLTTVKAGPDATGGTLTIVEFEFPPGYAVPPHSHRDEEELFYVLDGEVTFACDGEERTFTRGGMAWLPRRREHTFTVTDAGPARMFNIHTGPSFANLLREVGEIADGARLPEPPEAEPDATLVAAAFDRNGLDLEPPR